MIMVQRNKRKSFDIIKSRKRDGKLGARVFASKFRLAIAKRTLRVIAFGAGQSPIAKPNRMIAVTEPIAVAKQVRRTQRTPIRVQALRVI